MLHFRQSLINRTSDSRLCVSIAIRSPKLLVTHLCFLIAKGSLRQSAWPPAPSASSLLGCEVGSTCPNPALNVPQDRTCHEKSRATRVYVIIRDGTANLSPKKKNLSCTIPPFDCERYSTELWSWLSFNFCYYIASCNVSNFSARDMYRCQRRCDN